MVRLAFAAALCALASSPGAAASSSLRSSSGTAAPQYDVGVAWWPFQKDGNKPADDAADEEAAADSGQRTIAKKEAATAKAASAEPHYVFLQKFPLESTFGMLFHTEVIVCARSTFDAAFLAMLDDEAAALAPSRLAGAGGARDDAAAKAPFAPVAEERWSTQETPGCVQLGYGGANCSSGCCGSPHRHGNSHYALSSREAVIGNAVGERKELFFYGVSGGDAGIDGERAYEAVCHGQMNAIAMATDLPKCVSRWAGQDYNPLTNNCNTFTSTVLKCVYGLSDAKPNLGVSDMITVKCPNEKGEGEAELAAQCEVPTSHYESVGAADVVVEEA